MAIDTMEGYLDAYRLAVVHGISRRMVEAITMFADFLVRAQNPTEAGTAATTGAGADSETRQFGIRETGREHHQSESKRT